MSDMIEVAQRQLWDTAQLRQVDVERLLGRLADRAVDIGELFFQAVRSEAWVIEDGIIKEGAFSADRGVGVRAVPQQPICRRYVPAVHRHTKRRASLTVCGAHLSTSSDQDCHRRRVPGEGRVAQRPGAVTARGVRVRSPRNQAFQDRWVHAM